MQAITTTYHGPTARKYATIVAKSASGQRASFTFDSNLDIVENHRVAAEGLASRLDWGDTWVGGCIGADVYAWVATETNTDRFTLVSTFNRVLA